CGVNDPYLKVYLKLWKLIRDKAHTSTRNAFADDIARIVQKVNVCTSCCDSRSNYGRKATAMSPALMKQAWRRLLDLSSRALASCHRITSCADLTTRRRSSILRNEMSSQCRSNRTQSAGRWDLPRSKRSTRSTSITQDCSPCSVRCRGWVARLTSSLSTRAGFRIARRLNAA